MLAVPEIRRRVKTNARGLKLRIAHHQVYLTVPPSASEKAIQAFLKQSEPWLISTWNQHYAQNTAGLLPLDGELISFPLLAQTYQLSLKKDLPDPAQNTRKLIVQDNLLLVEASRAASTLKAWIRGQATVVLTEQLSRLAQQYDFSYQRCQVRHARTRWGSCSSQKSISLNAALVLLPVELVNYVLLHELCHTRQLNHSAKFWQEMAQVDRNYLHHRQQLKKIKLPAWWHAH